MGDHDNPHHSAHASGCGSVCVATPSRFSKLRPHGHVGGHSRVFYLLSAKDAEDIGLGDQHLYEEMARSLEDRSIPFIPMHQLDEEARQVYDLWANKSDKIVFSRSDWGPPIDR